MKIIKRADWGWIPLEDTIKTHKINYITIHHGGVEFNKDKDPLQHLKNLQTWSRKDKKWIDIPYHFMIDLEGIIYEARPINYPGDTNTEYDPTGHALVEVMGNYEVHELNKKQLESLIEIISFLAKEYNVPPDRIKTHKDYSNSTDCPGKNIYKYFKDGSIINSIRSRMNNESIIKAK